MNKTNTSEAVSSSLRNVESDFDLSALKTPVDVLDGNIGVKAHPTTLPVRKPNKNEFVRIREGDEFTMPATLITDGERGDTEYIVTGEMCGHPIVVEQARHVNLFLAINRQGVEFLWSVPIPGSNGRPPMEWHLSHEEAATLAHTKWIKMVAEQNQYCIMEALGELSDPAWKEGSFAEKVQKSFKGRIIDSDEHDIIKLREGRM